MCFSASWLVWMAWLICCDWPLFCCMSYLSYKAYTWVPSACFPLYFWLHLVRLPHEFPCSPSLFVWLFSRALHTHVQEWQEKRVEREKIAIALYSFFFLKLFHRCDLYLILEWSSRGCCFFFWLLRVNTKWTGNFSGMGRFYYIFFFTCY